MASAMQRLDGQANRELADMFTLLQSHGRIGQEQLTHLAGQLGGSVAAEVLRVRRERCGVGGKKSFNRASFIEHFKDTFYVRVLVTSTRERVYVRESVCVREKEQEREKNTQRECERERAREREMFRPCCRVHATHRVLTEPPTVSFHHLRLSHHHPQVRPFLARVKSDADVGEHADTHAELSLALLSLRRRRDFDQCRQVLRLTLYGLYYGLYYDLCYDFDQCRQVLRLILYGLY